MVCFKGKSNANQLQVVGRVPKNVGIRDFKVYEDEKIKVRGHESVVFDGIKTATKPPMLMRKSLPFKIGINQMDSSGIKRWVENSDKGKSKHNSSAKIKVGRKVLADISNSRSNLPKNQVSEGPKSVKTATKPPVLMRKSSLIKIGIKQMNSSSVKECVENSDKGKSKHDSSAKIKVGQKVFADISNARSNFPRKRMSYVSKPVKTATKPPMPMRKSLPVKIGTNQMDSSGVKGCVKNSDKGKSKHANSVHIKVGRKILADISNARSNLARNRISEGSKPMVSVGQRCTGPSASSGKLVTRTMRTIQNQGAGDPHTVKNVKVKVGRKVVPDISNARSNIWKNRASEGFMSVFPAGHNIVGAGSLSSKPLRPIRSTFTVSTSRMSSKSKRASGLKKSTSATATSSKSKVEVLTNAIPKNVAFVVSHESSIEECSSDGNNCSSKNTTDVISRAKSSRRRSFTSSLMAKSEVLRECGEVIKQEKLPSIDDDLNHLEVAEYVDEIYQYYWVMEVQYPSLANYMEIQTDTTPKMRGILINWLIEVHFKFDLMQETLFLMVALFDRFLSMNTIKKNEIQLVGLTALLLASKYEDFWHPKVKDLISIAADPSYTRDQMLAMEKLILKKLMFRLNSPTPYVFMLRFLKAAQSDTKLEHLSFYLIELCLVEYEALKFKPSLLCASAIYVARCTLKMTPTWTPLLCKHTRYEESQLRACANMILSYQKSAKTGPLKVSYEKYLQPELSCVAEIKAMNQLPH